MASRRHILIIVVHILGLCISTSAPQNVQHKSHKSQQQFEKELIENTTFSFVKCNNNTSSQRMINCTIYLETNTSSNVTSCKVNLTSDNENNIIGSITRAVSFGQNKVILIWLEKEKNLNLHVKFRIVNFPNCEVTESKITFDAKKFSDSSIDEIVEWGVSVVTYKDTYDVFYAKENSDSYEFCKQSFSTKKKDDPICILSTITLPSYTLFHTIDPDASESKGYVIFLPNGDSINAWLLTASGDTKIIETYKKGLEPIRRFVVSSSNGAIGICYQRRHGQNLSLSNATCSQYDLDSMNKTIEIHSNLEDNGRITDMYNLPNGGFLAMTRTCSIYSCFGSKNEKFRVMKLGMDEQKFKPLEISGFKCADDIFNVKRKTQFFENDERNFCLSCMCYRNSPNESNRRFNITTNCFTEQELSEVTHT